MKSCAACYLAYGAVSCALIAAAVYQGGGWVLGATLFIMFAKCRGDASQG
jgi:ribulose 1,5-bisphosphate synthetase/thiazole synthase